MHTRTVDIEIPYLEPYTPPRCRKPRCKVASFTATFDCEVYSRDEFPVAFTVHANVDGVSYDIRTYGGRLYREGPRAPLGPQDERWREEAAMTPEEYVDFERVTGGGGACSQWSRRDMERLADDGTLWSDAAWLSEENVRSNLREFDIPVWMEDGAGRMSLWSGCDEPVYARTGCGDIVRAVPASAADLYPVAFNALQTRDCLYSDPALADWACKPENPASDVIDVHMPELVRADPNGDRLRDSIRSADAAVVELQRRIDEATARAGRLRSELDVYVMADLGALANVPGGRDSVPCPWQRTGGIRRIPEVPRPAFPGERAAAAC